MTSRRCGSRTVGTRPLLRLVPAPGHTRGMQVVVVETGVLPLVVVGDVAVRLVELDEPG